MPETTEQPETTHLRAVPRRRRDIQGLRAIAVLLVVVFHAGLPVPGGFVGVDVFFVVSGFVITGMLHREWLAAGRIRFGRFYQRRFQRLTPALALMVSVVVVTSLFVLSPLGSQQVAAKTAIGAMLLCANFVIARTTGGYFDAPAASNPLLNTWSLSVEEQFYLAFPALIAMGWYVSRRRGLWRLSPYLLVAGIGAASLALAMSGASGLTFRGSGEVLGFYSPFTRAWEFAVGALLALAVARMRPTSSHLPAVAGLSGLALIAAGALLISSTTPFPGPWTLAPVVGAALVILAGCYGTGGATRLLSTEPFVKVGDWSYSIYLWHWPFIVFAALLWPGQTWIPLTAAALSFVPALASYYWLEEPLRARTDLQGPRLAAMVTSTLGIPIVLGLSLVISANQGYWSPVIRQYQAATIQDHVGFAAGCHTAVPISHRDPSDCVWNATSPGKPIYLIGDSNADHFSEAVVDAATALERPLTITTVDACPFFDGYVAGVSVPNPFLEPCRAFFEETYSWLLKQPAGIVIVAMTDSAIRNPETALGPNVDAMSSDPATKAKSLEVGLESVVDGLQQSGHEVLLVQTVPHFVDQYEYDATRCSIRQLIIEECGETMPFSFTSREQFLTRRAITSVATSTGARVLDLETYFCTSGTCSTRTGGMIVYRNGTHISVPASHALGGEFVAALDRAG